jgi:preprotein translocase subunit YajC
MIGFLAQASDSGQTGSPLGFLVPLLVLGVLFYFLLIRPQQRRVRAQRDLIASVEVGDEIMTAGGILGTVRAIDDDDDLLTVEIAPNTNIRVVKRAVQQRYVEDAGAVADDEDYDEEEDGADDEAATGSADEAGGDSPRA